MPTIFISYRREDSAGHAGRLLDALRSRFGKAQVLMDVDAIAPGTDFVRRIEEAVQTCQVVLVLIGREWLETTEEPKDAVPAGPGDYVRLEVEVALRSGVTIIPVLVEGASMPEPEDLPDAIRALARRNAIELSDVRWHYDVGRLGDVIEAVPNKEPAVQAEADEDLATGSELGGYRIAELVSRGPLAGLYRATQPHSVQEVALKVFAPEYGQNRSFREHLRRESTIAASIEHPNVLPVYETGEDDGMLFLAERWVTGGSLRRLIDDKGPLEPMSAARLIAQVADALDEAHAQRLVHSDIHPANILLESGHVYVSDFGLTKHTISKRGLTTTGQWIGTVDYISPEQVKGLKLGPRSDIYSLGCVLYEALSARVPWEGNGDLAKVWARIGQPSPPLDRLATDVPSGMVDVVLRAMMREPEERFSSAGELAAAGLRAAAL